MLIALYIILALFTLSIFLVIEGYALSIEPLNKDDIDSLSNKAARFLLRSKKRVRITISLLRFLLTICIMLLFSLFFIELKLTHWLLYSFLSSIFSILISLFLHKTTPIESAVSYVNNFSFLVIVFYFILFPFTILFTIKRPNKNTNAVIDDDITSEEDLVDTINNALDDGAINEDEKEMILDVMEFDEQLVKDVMTPRIKISYLDNKETKATIISAYKKTGLSRLPVYDENDNVIGILHYKTFIEKCYLGKEKYLNVLSHPLFVSEYEKASSVLKKLRLGSTHLAIVKDEFDTVVGLVTLEDLLEEIVGEIYDEHDLVISNFKQNQDGSYTVSGDIEIDFLFEKLDIELEESKFEEIESNTLNGYLIEELGFIPRKGDQITLNNVKYIILKADETKINSVLIKKVSTKR